MTQAKYIQFGTPSIGKEELEGIDKVLKSRWLTHGPIAKQFEEEFAKKIGSKYAVAVNSCTAALHLSLVALGIGEGDEVIVPSQTHVATAHSVVYTGATPVFCDVSLVDYNMSVYSVKECITKNTKAIIPVHFAGYPCEMDELHKLANELNIYIIEDAAHALGAEYKGKKIGSLDSNSTCFSFYPIKHITTGEGGMLCTNDEKIAEKATLMRAFGIDKSTWQRTTTERPCYYEVNAIGYNYRMTEIGAAMGLAQLKKLEKFNVKRAKYAKMYEAGLDGVEGISLPKIREYVKHANLFYQILVKDKRDELIVKLKDKGIGVSVHYPVPVHQMPVYKEMYGNKFLPNADSISKEAISLPVHPSLTEEDVKYVIENIKELL